MKKYIIYGVGKKGREAFEKYKEHVAFFVDQKCDDNSTFCGLKVYCPDVLAEYKECYTIVISSKRYREEILHELEKHDVQNYIYFDESDKLYGSEGLVYNPYEYGSGIGFETESEWNSNKMSNEDIQRVNQKTEDIYNKNKTRGEELLFNHIEIETVNRCNGVCSFCPVNVKVDKRPLCKMNDELFYKIINQLAEIYYSGRIALFSNNEPFLDPLIVERYKYAREKLPNARFHMFTNGTLLTMEKFVDVIEYLDEMVIDNYSQDLELIEPCKKIVAYADEHPEISEKVTIVLRKPNEILTSRGGDAPNRNDVISYPNDRCLLPFTQMVIRPDGKVSLCCNDPLGKNTVGDLTKETIIDVWNGEKFKHIRECIYKGRINWEHCKLCDTFYI